MNALKMNTRDLWSAVCRNDVENVLLCVNSGIDVNQVCDGGDSEEEETVTCLMLAGSVQMASTLLDCGARINDRTYWGATALYFAAKRGNNDLVFLLCSRGADVNIDDDYGVTPLEIARRGSDALLIDILVAHGAVAGDCEESANPSFNSVSFSEHAS